MHPDISSCLLGFDENHSTGNNVFSLVPECEVIHKSWILIDERQERVLPIQTLNLDLNIFSPGKKFFHYFPVSMFFFSFIF